MPPFALRPYAGADFHAVVDLLQRALPADPLTPELFTRKALLDPNFDPEGAPVAAIGTRVVGFLLAIARKRPLEDGPDDSDRSWITLFAVEPDVRHHGIGTTLLERGLDYLRTRRCRSVLISPYAPNYFAPGVDLAAYPEAVAFLEARGFRTVSRPVSMDARLTGGWRIPDWVLRREERLESERVHVTPWDPTHAPALTAFLRDEFPGDWQRYLRETLVDVTLGRRAADDVLLAFDGPALVGFSQHEGERFGPFGVAESQRGRGIGALLLFRTLETMRRKGHHTAWFLWTDDATADRIYRAAGFCETRRYAVLRRDL